MTGWFKRLQWYIVVNKTSHCTICKMHIEGQRVHLSHLVPTEKPFHLKWILCKMESCWMSAFSHALRHSTQLHFSCLFPVSFVPNGRQWWVVELGTLTRQVPFDSWLPGRLARSRSFCIVSSAKCAMQETKQPHAPALHRSHAHSSALWNNGTRIVSGEITVKEQGKSTTRTITSVWHIWQCVFKLAKTKRMWQPQNRIEHSGKVSGKWVFSFYHFPTSFFSSFFWVFEVFLSSALNCT